MRQPRRLIYISPNHDKLANALLGRALEMDPEDQSGTLIELARRRGNLRVLSAVPEHEVLVEFPFGEVIEHQTGRSRFLRRRSGGYALVF